MLMRYRMWIVVGMAGMIGLLLGLATEQWLLGSFGLVVASTLIVGGVLGHLLEPASAAICSPGPRLRPLHLAAFSALAAGVQVLRAAEQAPQLIAAWPWMIAFPIGPAAILGGMACLAWLSVQATCRDEALMAQMGKE
ncbi:MAG: hypothetical protein Fur005_39030 [Roseiflexaceae bacterium]